MAILLVEFIVLIISHFYYSIFNPKSIRRILTNFMMVNFYYPIVYILTIKKGHPLLGSGIFLGSYTTGKSCNYCHYENKWKVRFDCKCWFHFYRLNSVDRAMSVSMFECRAYYTINEKSFEAQRPSSDCLKLHARVFLSPVVWLFYQIRQMFLQKNLHCYKYNRTIK